MLARSNEISVITYQSERDFSFLSFSIKLLSCLHSFFRLFPLDIIAGSTLALDPIENCSVSTFYRHVCVPLTMAEAYQAERPAVFPGCLHMCIVGKPLMVN